MKPRNLRSAVLPLMALALALLGAPVASGAPEPWVLVTDTGLTSDHQGSIVIGANGITLDCRHHSLTGPGFAGVLLQNVTGATVKNCNVGGFEVGFYFVSAPANRLEGNVSEANANDGYALATSPNNNGNILVDNVSNGNGRWGFAVYDNTTDTALRRNVATTAAGAGFFIGLGSNRTHLVENRSERNASSGFDIDSDANVVERNTARNNPALGFLIFQASGNEFSGNVAEENGGGFGVGGSGLHDASHNTFVGNSARSNAQLGFGLGPGSSSARLIGNSASENSIGGFQLDQISDNLLDGNEATGNGVNGFSLNSVLASTLTRNTARSNGTHGISLLLSNGNELTKNSSTGNGGLGFLLAASNENNLSQNSAIGNVLAGFRSSLSMGNTLSRDLSSQNLNGFVLIGSNNELLEHNLATRNLGDGFGLADSSENQLTENIGNANGEFGFETRSGSIGNTLARNIGHGNVTLDARDENLVGANQWIDNNFGSSSIP